MEITNLLDIDKLTPLSNAVAEIDSAAFLGTALYRLGGGVYFYLTKFAPVAANSEGPYLCGLFFAADDGAMMRATALRIEEDTGAMFTPPPGLLPSELVPEYGSILSWLKKMRPKVCQQTASYRIASDGLFIHRKIETEKYTVYFRGRNDDDHEPPYAILYKY